MGDRTLHGSTDVAAREWRLAGGPYEVAVGGTMSAAFGGSELPPLQLIVQFVAPDPLKRPILP